MEERTISITGDGERLARVMVECGLAASNTAATRLIDQGSVRVDGEKVSDRFLTVDPQQGPFVLQVGKRKVVRVRPVQK